MDRWQDLPFALDVLATDEAGSADSPETQLRNRRGEAAIRQIGAKALPPALAWCAAVDSQPWQQFDSCWSGEALHFLQIRPADEKHLEAIAIYEALGRTAKPAIPSLIEMLRGNDPFIYDPAMQGLYAIGPDAVPALIQELASNNLQGQLNAATCLGYILAGRRVTPARYCCNFWKIRI